MLYVQYVPQYIARKKRKIDSHQLRNTLYVLQHISPIREAFFPSSCTYARGCREGTGKRKQVEKSALQCRAVAAHVCSGDDVTPLIYTHRTLTCFFSFSEYRGGKRISLTAPPQRRKGAYLRHQHRSDAAKKKRSFFSPPQRLLTKSSPLSLTWIYSLGAPLIFF